MKNQEKKEKNIKKSKIHKDMHEESLEDFPSWWWRTKMTFEKVGGPKCIKLEKFATQFWLKKGLIGENVFIWGK